MAASDWLKIQSYDRMHNNAKFQKNRNVYQTKHTVSCPRHKTEDGWFLLSLFSCD